ncbi:LIM/homeobox protein Lhx8, partial [Tyrophagus putrescentiae]
ICFGCRETLATSRIIVSVSGHHNYHTSCLCCCECGQSLCQFPTCYIRHGRMYCKEDYAKLVKCSKCSRPIAADDWVRRAGELVYHLACFSCDLCQRQLSTGENFTVVRQDPAEWRLLCKLHFSVKSDKDETKNQVENGSSDVELASPGALSQSAATMLISDSNGGANTNNSNANNANNGTPSGALTPTGQRTTGGGGGGGSSGSSSSNSALSASSSSKTKRVRTTFTEEQLSVLQANFQLDSNPDGQDLERIATLTGLSKRVTQVWFQNSRARQKKYMNKSHQRHSPGLLATVGGGGGPSSMLLNGGGGGGGAGNGHGGLWSPGSSTGSSTGNDCLAAVAAAAVHTVSNNNNSQALSLDCLSGVGSGAGGGSTGTGGGCLSTPSTAKWAQSNSSNSLNNNLNDSTTVSSQCTESEHSSSPQHM